MKLQMEVSHEPRSKLLKIGPEQTFSLQSELILLLLRNRVLQVVKIKTAVWPLCRCQAVRGQNAEPLHAGRVAPVWTFPARRFHTPAAEAEEEVSD